MKPRLLIGILVLFPIFAHLLYAGITSPLANYYITVNEVLAQEAQFHLKRIRVGGDVVAGSVQWDSGGRTLRFTIADNGQNLDVVYKGFAPDNFRPGTTVIVEGEHTSKATFNAYNLAVKCPHSFVAS